MKIDQAYGEQKRYKAIEVLGEGGFGVVYLALDTKLSRRVAIKVTKRRLSKEVSQRFKREATVTPRLRHPNIVKIFDMDVLEGSGYLVMEYFEDADLEKTLKKRKFSIQESLFVVAQLASALSYLEENSIIHRDIKPANIIVRTNDLHTTLMDFGLVLSDESTVVTKTGRLIGTPHYLAPELWLGSPFSSASDIYALGLVLHQLLVGEFVFASCNFVPYQTIAPPLPSLYNSKVTPELDAFVTWCTDADSESRCQNGSQFLERLSQTCVEGRYVVERIQPCTRHVNTQPDSQSSVVTVGSLAPQGKCNEKDSLGGVRFLTASVLVFLLLFYLQVHYSGRISKGGKIGGGRLESQEFAAFPNGLVFSFAGDFQNLPSYSLRNKEKIIADGICVRKKLGYYVALWKLPSNLKREELVFSVFLDRETLFSKQFFLPETTFVMAPRARAGKETVKLRWKLHGDARIDVVAKWAKLNRSTSLVAVNNKCTLISPDRCGSVSYQLSLYNKVLYHNEVFLGCISRRHSRLMPDKPSYQIRHKVIVFDDSIIGDASRDGLLCLACPRDGSGPHLFQSWLAKPNIADGYTYPLYKHSETTCLVKTIASPKLVYSYVDIKMRNKIKKGFQPVIGKGSNEKSIEYPEAVSSSDIVPFDVWSNSSKTRVNAYCGIVTNIEGMLGLFCITENDGQPFLKKGSVLGAASASKVFKVRDNLFFLMRVFNKRCFCRLVSIRMSASPRFAIHSETSIFNENESCLLPSLPSNKAIFGTFFRSKPPKFKKNRLMAEIDMCALDETNIIVRAGPYLKYVRLNGKHLETIDQCTVLPIKCVKRVSPILPLSHKDFVLVTITSNDSVPPYSEATLHKFAVVKGRLKSIQEKVVARTIHMAGWEARCSIPCLHNGFYYQPALNNVLVLDKKYGKLHSSINCLTRPNSAFVVNSTLFVPSACRELRGICLIDNV